MGILEIPCGNIGNTNTYRYLRVWLNNSLDMNKRLNDGYKMSYKKVNKLKKLRKQMSVCTAVLVYKQFCRIRKFLTVKAAMMVYKGMLLSLLEYGDIFLTGVSALNRKRLQILQKKGLRCALNKDIDFSINDLHSEVLLKLKYRKEKHLLNYMYYVA